MFTRGLLWVLTPLPKDLKVQRTLQKETNQIEKHTIEMTYIVIYKGDKHWNDWEVRKAIRNWETHYLKVWNHWTPLKETNRRIEKEEILRKPRSTTARSASAEDSLLKSGAVECDSDEAEELLHSIDFDDDGQIAVGHLAAFLKVEVVVCLSICRLAIIFLKCSRVSL